MQTKFFGLLAVLAATHATARADEGVDVPTPPDTGAPTAAAPSDKVLLRLHLQAGQLFDYKVSSDTKMTQIMPKTIAGRSTSAPGMPGGRMEIGAVSDMTMRYDVLDVDAQGVATVKLTYKSMQTKISSPFLDAMKAGHKGRAAAQPDPTRALIGQSITLKMTPDGRVTDLQGMDKLMAHIFDSLKGPGMTPQMIETSKKTMRQMMGDRFFKDIMEKATAGFPPGPVSVGEAWPYQVGTASNANFPILIEGTRTLTNRRNGIATISEQSNIKANNAAVQLQSGGIKINYNIQGTQSGTTQMDEAIGLPSSAKIAQRMAGTITVSGVPNQSQAISTRFYSRTNITMSIVPVDK